MQTKAVILVGGKSSRMGENKALLKLNGKTLLENMLEKLKELTCEGACEDIYISGEIAGYENCIPDTEKELGALGGISAVFNSHKNNQSNDDIAFLFVPVDMPALASQLLKRLITEIESHTSAENKACDAVYFEICPLPLLVRNTPEIRQKIAEQITSKKLSIKNFLSEINSHSIILNSTDKNQLQNVNTPQEWEKFLDEN